MFIALFTLCLISFLAGYVMGKKKSEIRIKILEAENEELNLMVDPGQHKIPNP